MNPADDQTNNPSGAPWDQASVPDLPDMADLSSDAQPAVPATPALDGIPAFPTASTTVTDTTSKDDAGLPNFQSQTTTTTSAANPPVNAIEPLAVPPPPATPPTEMPTREEVTTYEQNASGDEPVNIQTKKSNSMPIIAGVVAVVLLVGAGVFALYGQTLLQVFRGDIRQQAALVPACRDGKDNDGDGKIDCVTGVADPGCFPDNSGGGGACNPNDENEIDSVTTPLVEEDVLECTEIVLYWNNNNTWTKGTPAQVAANTASGEEIRMAVKPVDGTASVARFRVNEGEWTESTTKNEAGEFFLAYTPTSFTTFKVEAQIGAYGYED